MKIDYAEKEEALSESPPKSEAFARPSSAL
jgi:hypothetical protein